MKNKIIIIPVWNAIYILSNQNQAIANLKCIITLLEPSNLGFNKEEILKLNKITLKEKILQNKK